MWFPLSSMLKIQAHQSGPGGMGCSSEALTNSTLYLSTMAASNEIKYSNFICGFVTISQSPILFHILSEK